MKVSDLRESCDHFSFFVIVRSGLCVLQREDHRYPSLIFTQTELQERFKRQLSVEQACTATIDSVEAAKPVTENMAKMVKEQQ